MNKTDNIITRLADKVKSNTDAIDAIKRALSIKSLDTQSSISSSSMVTDDHQQLVGRDSEDSHPISSITGLTGYIDTANDKVKASALELHGVNDYYGSITLTNTAGADGYMVIQSRQEGVGWRNTVLNPSGGNVGIGTTSPTELLHLGKSSAVQVTTLYQNSNASLVVGVESGGNGIVWNRSNYYIRFGTNATERMRITADGNVGIGTVSPSQKLTVNGGVCMQTLYIPNNGAMSTTYSLSVNTNAITAEIPS